MSSSSFSSFGSPESRAGGCGGAAVGGGTGTGGCGTGGAWWGCGGADCQGGWTCGGACCCFAGLLNSNSCSLGGSASSCGGMDKVTDVQGWGCVPTALSSPSRRELGTSA